MPPRAEPARRGRPRVLLVGISRYLHGNPRGVSLACGYLKAYADAALPGRCSVRVLNLSGFNADRALEFSAAWKPDIVGFSCYLWNSPRVEALSRALKRRLPGVRVVLGGPEASGRGAELLRRSRADALVQGEGEAAFAELLGRFLDGRPWAGTAGVLTPGEAAALPRAILPALDAVPSPFLDPERNLGIRGPGERFYPYETMRGCPNKCTYCVWTDLAAKRPRYFPAERVEADLRWIAQHTPSSCVFIADSDMFLNRERALKLAPVFHAAAGAGKCYFIFQTNLNHWTPELMRAWNHENFDMNIGVNSVNPKVQAILGRSYPKSLVEEKLALMRRLAPRTKITMQIMFAAPGETFAEFCDYFDWAWRQPATYMLFFHTQPLHGTPMRDRAAGLGITARTRPPYHITSTRECTAAEIKTEGLMVLFVTVWMCFPGSRALFRRLADAHFGGSLSRAFLALWDEMPAAARRLGLAAWDRFNGGSDWFPDDFQLELTHGYEPPGTGQFIRAAQRALAAACARRLPGAKAAAPVRLKRRPGSKNR